MSWRSPKTREAEAFDGRSASAALVLSKTPGFFASNDDSYKELSGNETRSTNGKGNREDQADKCRK